MSGLKEYKTNESLLEHFNQKDYNLKKLFDTDNNRFNKFSVKLDNLLFDFSKHLIDDETFELLVQLAKEANIKDYAERMFSGEKINFTENRAVLHTALRDKSSNEIIVDGENVKKPVNDVLNQIEDFVKKIHSGEHTGYSGKKIDTIINIGIGGSDLGPKMVCNALETYAVKGMRINFVSNVDGTDIYKTLRCINPETTLFIIASKTFTTQETITNANTAKNWFLTHSTFENIKKHFIAVSTNSKAVQEFGISPDNMFEFWDWVGGRYSLWSAIGISIALYLGFDNFNKLLKGAYSADLHFRNTPYESNIPVIMALLGVWYNNYFGFKTHAVIPYDEYLSKFPEFLQQLDMESNGKYINIKNQKVNYSTGNIVWGTSGTNSQHSFFQLIHQGTQKIPVDFIAPVISHNEAGEHHNILLSNMIAQAEALMKGKSEEEVINEMKTASTDEAQINKIAPHKVFEGNRPSSTFLINQINPETLGMLIAFYEHKVFVQGVIWKINSFDQWGVELGKQLAKKILPEIQSDGDIDTHDNSTNALLNHINKLRK
jgi:glucose-6-phosphate isomerase